MNFTIRPARPEDAPFIATAIMQAVGEELTAGFAGTADRVPLVHETFSRLASRPGSQYSYTNALVAETDTGEVAGVVICYDGALLHTLRPEFVRVANDVLDLGMADSDFTFDETTPDEFYLDTLCVFEPWRRHGLARRLIDAAADRAAGSGKPLALLVDFDNTRARRLYDSAGFVPAGTRPFAGVDMQHMLRH